MSIEASSVAFSEGAAEGASKATNAPVRFQTGCHGPPTSQLVLEVEGERRRTTVLRAVREEPRGTCQGGRTDIIILKRSVTGPSATGRIR